MGRLLGSLRQSLYAKMRDPTEAVEKTRLAVYACHDTSVAGILCVCSGPGHTQGGRDTDSDAFQERAGLLRWALAALHQPRLRRYVPGLLQPCPMLTMSDVAELFRSGPPASGFLSSFKPPPPHYVRLRFNGRTMRLPACAPEGKHLPGSEGQVCTFEAFSEAARKVEVSQEEWRGLCGNAKE